MAACLNGQIFSVVRIRVFVCGYFHRFFLRQNRFHWLFGFNRRNIYIVYRFGFSLPICSYFLVVVMIMVVVVIMVVISAHIFTLSICNVCIGKCFYGEHRKAHNKAQKQGQETFHQIHSIIPPNTAHKLPLYSIL